MQIYNIPKLDANLFTGPVRLTSGIARMGDVVLDTPYGEVARFIYCSVAGDVSIVKLDGTNQLLVGMAAGFFHPIYSLQVNSVSTTATGLIWGS